MTWPCSLRIYGICHSTAQRVNTPESGFKSHVSAAAAQNPHCEVPVGHKHTKGPCADQ